MNKKYHYVYLILNTLNGKKYIGKRSSDVKPELDDKYMGSGINIKKAQMKYGTENFEKFILDVCSTEEDAYKLEELYIRVLNGVHSREFYNMCGGGLGSGSGNSHHSYGKKLSKETKDKIRSGVKKYIKRNKNKIGKKRILTKRKGWKHSEETILKLRGKNKGALSPLSKKVVMFDKDNFEKILEFESIKIATEYLEKDGGVSFISSVCRGQRSTAYGYKWAYSEDYKNKTDLYYKIINYSKSRKNVNGKKVVQISINTGNPLHIFKSIREADRYLGVTNKVSTIGKTCRGIQTQSYGYKWMYLDDYINKYGELPEELQEAN